MSERPVWNLTRKTWVSLLLLGLALWLVIHYAPVIADILWVLFAAWLVSLAIGPLASILKRWHIPRGATVILVYVFVIALFVLLGFLLADLVRAEYARVEHEIQALLQQILSAIASIPFLSNIVPSAGTLLQDITGRVSSLFQTLLSTITRISNVTVDILIAIILSYSFVVAGDIGKTFVSSWIPLRMRERVGTIVSRLQYRLSRWTWAQAAIALYFAVTYSIGLTVLGVPFGPVIGVIAGILEMIPYVGGLVGLLLAILSALTVRPILVLWVVIFHVIVVEIEAHVMSPFLYGRVLNMSFPVVLVALLVGVKVKGIIGVLFAVPAAAVVTALVHELRTEVVDQNQNEDVNAQRGSP